MWFRDIMGACGHQSGLSIGKLETIKCTAPGAKDVLTGRAIGLLLLSCGVCKFLLAAPVTRIDPSEQVIILVGACFAVWIAEGGGG
jgi:hypothetical protein